MDGSGVLRFAHGDTYEGQFLRGFFYGQGVYTFKDGGSYEVRNEIICIVCYAQKATED